MEHFLTHGISTGAFCVSYVCAGFDTIELLCVTVCPQAMIS